MQISYKKYDLKLRHMFTIARGSRVITSTVGVEIEHDGVLGYGEASPSERYHESVETVMTFLQRVDLLQFHDPFQLEEILHYVDAIAPGNAAAKASIDIALHDWIGKRLAIPLWKYWGVEKERTPLTSFTIGIDTPKIIRNKVLEAEEYPILKVKVGTPNDKEIIETIRSVTKKVIRVDANEGWRSKEEAVEKILWLESQGVEFIEQPMPAAMLKEIAWVRQRVNIPLIADENVSRLTDLPCLQDAFDGINIKLMKCSGMREALKLIHTARALDMKIMLGCMIESSVAIAAAASLSPLVDFADLDGNVLIVNDPFEGLGMQNGKIILNDRAGLGVSKNAKDN